ncbi:MAG: MmgE/PrpD family protein [Armatimonadota bacterium]
MKSLPALAGFITELTERVLPASARAHCGTLAADSVACTIGALQTSEGRSLARALCDVGSARPEGAVRYRVFSSAEILAGVHIDAGLANLLDFDDVFEGSGHIGCVALLERTGPEVLAAVAAGLEVGSRFLEACRPSEAIRAQVWGIGTRLTPAAAAVAAKLFSLGPDATAHALALACSTAPIPSVRKTVYGGTGVTWVKNNMAIAAVAGLTAALLAREGARGPLDVLDGPEGFARMIGTDVWNPEILTDGLGNSWTLERVGLKPYPCCRHAHAVIDAARMCMRKLGLTPGDVTEIASAGPVWIYSKPFTNPVPTTMLDAQYSLAYCLAVALVGVEPGLEWFDRVTFDREDVRRLASKVRTEGQPGDLATARVRISGAGRSAVVEVDAPRGSPAHPLSEEEQRAKFHGLVGGVRNR